jgi:lysophospholipase L1-like esterase
VRLEAKLGPHTVALEVDDPPVDLFGIALETGQPGVLVENLGTVGLHAIQLDGWDWTVIGPQLAARAPTLVILQFGTNEADQRSIDLRALEETFVRLIARIKAAVPGAAVLVLGPPDFAVRDRGKLCDPPPPRRRKKGHRGKRPPRPPILEGPPAPGCEWHTNPRLAPIIEAEARAATRAGVAFFDTLQAMGGPERMDAWVATGVAYRDHVHFLRAGYELWADALLADLLVEYDAWRVRMRLER